MRMAEADPLKGIWREYDSYPTIALGMLRTRDSSHSAWQRADTSSQMSDLLLTGKWASCKRLCRWQQRACCPWRRLQAPRRPQPSLRLLPDDRQNRCCLRVMQHSPARAASTMGSHLATHQLPRACRATGRRCHQSRSRMAPVLQPSSHRLQRMSRLPPRWQCNLPTAMCNPHLEACSAGWIWSRMVARWCHHLHFRRFSTAALRWQALTLQRSVAGREVAIASPVPPRDLCRLQDLRWRLWQNCCLRHCRLTQVPTALSARTASPQQVATHNAA